METPRGLATLYRQAAILYESTGRGQLGAVALEKATHHRSNDPQLHFDAAYAFSRQETIGSPLALLHYKAALDFNAQNSTALNNMGVQYSHLDMDFRSVAAYKKASELGETLAMSNLAFRYLQAGFSDEAKQVLRKATEQGVPSHEAIGRAVAMLADLRKKEETKEEEVLEQARQQQQFLRDFAEAYFETPSSMSMAGSWGSEAVLLSFEETDGRLQGRLDIDDKELIVLGGIKNRAATITTHKPRPDTSSDSLPIDREGLLFLDEASEEMRILLFGDPPDHYVLRRS